MSRVKSSSSSVSLLTTPLINRTNQTRMKEGKKGKKNGQEAGHRSRKTKK
jgi:hypothetical protein